MTVKPKPKPRAKKAAKPELGGARAELSSTTVWVGSRTLARLRALSERRGTPMAYLVAEAFSDLHAKYTTPPPDGGKIWPPGPLEWMDAVGGAAPVPPPGLWWQFWRRQGE